MVERGEGGGEWEGGEREGDEMSVTICSCFVTIVNGDLMSCDHKIT